jgi:hypothetical protein
MLTLSDRQRAQQRGAEFNVRSIVSHLIRRPQASQMTAETGTAKTSVQERHLAFLIIEAEAQHSPSPVIA